MNDMVVPAKRWNQFLRLTKPRVVGLIVFTAWIGMLLAIPPGLSLRQCLTMVAATVGIALVAGAAAAMNCLIEQKIDARMARTQRRPLPQGKVSVKETLLLAAIIGGVGLLVLYLGVNLLTMVLTLATFVGYAVIYTVLLKPATPQNIVIGGASGAMPPVLGWAAMRGELTAEPLLLFLIIFAWTPPHFWALALYRAQDYAQAGLPMLPVTHGPQFTRLHILLYTFILTAVTCLPFAMGMSGLGYLGGALLLDVIFIYYAWQLYRNYSDQLARRTFAFSIFYLAMLFTLLLLDHYSAFWLGGR